MTFEEVVQRFECARPSRDGGFMARCPAHEDRNPSLSISRSDDRALLFCHAGCSIDSIIAAVGLKFSDLRLNGRQTANGNQRQAQRIVATYDYTDEKGKLLYQNVRYEPKDFRLRRPDGKGWTWNLGNVRRVPYNLPRILASDDLVLIVEGEKDADTATKLGMAATSSKHWLSEFADYLQRKNVAIIADADDTGRKTATDVAQKLTGRVRSLKMFELPGSKDLTDWISTGGNKDLLLGFIEMQREWTQESNWRSIFHRFEDFENAPPLSFAIKDFLQNDGATLIGAVNSATWVARWEEIPPEPSR